MDDIQIIIYIVFGIIYLLLQVVKKRKRSEEADATYVDRDEREADSISFEEWMERLEGEKEEKPTYRAQQKNREIREVKEEAQEAKHKAERFVDDSREVAREARKSVREVKKSVKEAKDLVKEQAKESYQKLNYEKLSETRPKLASEVRKREEKRKVAEVKAQKTKELVKHMKKLQASEHYVDIKISSTASELIDEIKKDPSWAQKAVIYSEIINKKYDA
jgi:hypothetical protein